MTALSNYAENAMLDHLVGNTAFTKPTNTYIKLHTGDPGEDCTLAAAGETLRKILSWAASASRVAVTDAAVNWASMTAAETITHYSIWDALTGGNPLFYGAFASGQTVGIGDELDIASGDVDCDFTTGMLTTATGNSAVDHLTGRTAWTQPAGHFIKLHTGAPGIAATGSPATETTRQSAGAFSAASGGTSDNDADIDWTSVSTTETITDISGWDTVTGGIALYQGSLSSSVGLTAGQNAKIPAGSLDLALL